MERIDVNPARELRGQRSLAEAMVVCSTEVMVRLPILVPWNSLQPVLTIGSPDACSLFDKVNGLVITLLD